jgi:carbohydrate kinase (thermoresistant glucokinase family)
MTIPTQSFILIMMGPMGCGKTTVGRLLAQTLAWPFIDADDFHPAANVAKMRQGVALNDADRRPWLEALRAAIDRWRLAGQSGIMACSALKKTYRRILGVDQQTVRTVYLQGSFELLHARIEARRNHYMPTDLLQSQLDTLEPPAGGLTVDISVPPEAIVAHIINQIQIDSIDSSKKET